MRTLVLLLLLVACAVADDSVRLDEKTTGFQIHVRYPKLAFDRGLLEGFARKQIADFKEEFQETTGGKPYRVPFTLDLDYTIPWQTDRFTVVYFVGSSYTGGAHPAPFLNSFVLDAKSGKALALADMFQGAYLEEFSRFARAELGKRDISSEADWIARGTEPKLENFSVAYPTEKGFVLIFPPYQVAPYVVGPQEVVIPWKSLAPYQGIFDPLY